ncbi:Xylanolytic transcriptional activator xlnR-like protein [Lachnellula occidentalis]|uniref:Xylanolytic transcriptional activator xlnR-like protein n=1 Tax=Lachnellula occidentalis TaxID=215460 RepID=A0A8H8S305_9HELO|nr:Xylanolytic transcriptional activator xlnR-like protein [Lachnellula occidentalis]
MLSNPLHRFSAYNALPSSGMLGSGHVPSNHMHSGLDTVAHGSQYAFQQLQQHVDQQNSQVHRNHNSKHRQHPYGHGPANGRSSGAGVSGPIRRRISRACDQCNQLRTKCDGQAPCAHCVEFGLGCEYIRERKKRGKASRKDLAQQAAAAAANGQKSPSGQSSGERSPTESRHESGGSATTSLANDNHEFKRPQPQRSLSLNTKGLDNGSARETLRGRLRTGSLESLTGMPHGHQPHLVSRAEADQIESPASLNMSGYSSMHGYRPAINSHLMNSHGGNFSAGQGSLPGYTDLQYAIQTQSPTHYPGNTPGPFRLGDSSLPGFPMGSDAASPGGWMSLPSPSNQYQQHVTRNFNTPLRYPVLQPLVPHLGNIIPLSLACDLLDLYFASSSSALMHPTSPYVLGYVFRKHSILHPTKPRQCTPALLASMLWVVAQTSDAAFLTAPPSSRGKICQRLLELTVGLLKPLIHGSSDGESSPDFSSTVINGVALGGLGVTMPGSMNSDSLTGETGPFGATGTLDDVVTYIHLATVVSASEYKGASLRWWNAAWSLARELKLGRELPQSSLATMSPQQPAAGVNDVDADGEADDDVPHGAISEEEREERRRVWWLAYTVDRHLALCYNRPLFLLDIECDSLLQPMDDTLWQAGEFYTGDSSIHITSPSGTPRIRRRGPNFECTGHSIFGYFLPLMTILGEIVDLFHAKNHPRFGIGFRSAQEWDDHASEIARQLEAYGQSLKDFEARNPSISIEEPENPMEGNDANTDHAEIGTPSVHSIRTTSSAHISEADIQTRIVVAYGTHVMHVLHILLTGKWDPISLLDDNDLWISSQSFINATGHAVSAAEAIDNILEYDPGLEFMPFFFGVYLLQGSFLLLLIADKLQVRTDSFFCVEASPSVIKACETIVRAHEACVVTLNTEYQRNFRKVMRSALAQVRGRVPEDFGEQQLRRREVLALYRWTGDGTGLAL